MRVRFSILSGVVILGCGLAVWLNHAGLTGLARAQEATGPEMLDFKAQLENHLPPNEGQVKTLLEGAKAQPRSGQIWITEAKLKTFSTNGALELLAETPQCVFDAEQRTVSSAGPLQVQTADKRLYLEGEGFLLRGTNSNLIISNRVHTIIRNLSGKTPKP